jgi:hypothetical protein
MCLQHRRARGSRQPVAHAPPDGEWAAATIVFALAAAISIVGLSPG